MALSKVFPDPEGNHVHQWLHLDLNRMFGIKDLLSAKTGDSIWRLTKEKLGEDDMLPQAIFKKVEARIICTTDDPVDDLRYHEVAKEKIEGVTFLPTFRPDAYCRIYDEKWSRNVEKICSLAGKELTLKGLVDALRERHAYFAQMGTRASDHNANEYLFKN